MGWNAKGGRVPFPDTEMDYLRFGTGKEILIMLPGLGDGLRSVRGMALPMAMLYRMYARDYTVYMFSRKNKMAPGTTTRDMALDVKQAMDELGIGKAHVLGVSMGGMIAQHLASDFPEKVGKLLLVVTAPRPNPVLTDSVSLWISQAKAGDHTALMESNLKRIYSHGYYRRNKWMVPILGKVTKPKSYEKFLVMADACLSHDASNRLKDIAAPTMVMGGEQDETLGGEASRELARGIPGAKLRMFPQWGHGLYEEAPEFHKEVLDFLKTS